MSRCEIVPGHRRLRRKRTGHQLIAYRGEAGIERNRLRLRARELHPVVLGRIVRGRDHHAAVEPVFPNCKVQRVRRNQADIGNVGAGIGRSARERIEKGDAGWTHVAARDDALGPEQRHEAAPDAVSDVIVDFGRINPANVVGLENSRIYLRLHGLPRFGGTDDDP